MKGECATGRRSTCTPRFSCHCAWRNCAVATFNGFSGSYAYFRPATALGPPTLLQELLCPGRIEPGQRVCRVHVADKGWRDDAASRRCANDVLADNPHERRLVDG